MDDMDERNEAVEAVVERVRSYQDGAPESTVEQELRSGLAEAGVEASDDEVAALVARIEQETPGA